MKAHKPYCGLHEQRDDHQTLFAKPAGAETGCQRSSLDPRPIGRACRAKPPSGSTKMPKCDERRHRAAGHHEKQRCLRVKPARSSCRAPDPEIGPKQQCHTRSPAMNGATGSRSGEVQQKNDPVQDRKAHHPTRSLGYVGPIHPRRVSL